MRFAKIIFGHTSTTQYRRLFFVLCAACSLMRVPSLAESNQVQTPPKQHISIEDLMKPASLPDVPMGVDSAPVTLVEYGSLTCHHCADFHNVILPELEKKYITTGQVRYIFREFPLDPLAIAGFMLARCSMNQNRQAIVDLLFSRQKEWAFVEKLLDALTAVLKQAGFTPDTVQSCLKDNKLYENVKLMRTNAAKDFDINATPTFFINGNRYPSDKNSMNAEAFGKAIEAALAKGHAPSASTPPAQK